MLGQLHELGNLLLSGLLSLAAAAAPASLPCACGATASFCRLRPATVTTLLGRLTYTRATYHRQTCHHGHAPLDRQLQVAAGSFSLGLQEVLALLGATQDLVCRGRRRAGTTLSGAGLSQRVCAQRPKRWVPCCSRTLRKWCATPRNLTAFQRPRRLSRHASTSVWTACWSTVVRAAGVRSRSAVSTPLDCSEPVAHPISRCCAWSSPATAPAWPKRPGLAGSWLWKRPGAAQMRQPRWW